MIILSDCFAEKIDEGCLKVANSLSKRIKRTYDDTLLISYGKSAATTDMHLKLNKLFLNKSLAHVLRKKKKPVLYIPFASNTRASVLRLLVLSMFTRTKIYVIFALRYHMDRLTVTLLKASKANVIALSNDSYQYYKELLGERTFYLKTGVDTEKFVPVDAARKQELRKKYGVDDGKKIVLHVGHLKNGRNVDKLLGIDEKYHVILVVSSVTQQDTELRRKLEERPNITIIDDYLENIEEIYQLSDIYLFPVQTLDNCIDVPLSVLEAASCGISIVATRYGELREFNANDGFAFIDTLSDAELNKKLDEMSAKQFSDNRLAVQEYDWDSSIKKLIALTSLGE